MEGSATRRWWYTNKLQALDLYRSYNVATDGVTLRELAQWDALERYHPQSQLRIRKFSITDLRMAPKAPINLSKGKIALPPMTRQQQCLCLVVKMLTEFTGVCTYVDLAHGLHEFGAQRAANTEVFDVQLCRVKKILAAAQHPNTIGQLWGRGYQWQHR